MTGSDDLEIHAKGPATIERADPRTRMWTLLLLDAASRNGITPLSKLRFHRIAYLANGMSRVFGIRAADERVVKHRRGPFYPDLQWHLDRLLGQGLIRVAAVRHFTDGDGPWMDANYSMAARSVPIIKDLCRLESAANLAAFHLEVVRAYAAQEEEALDGLALSDVTYADMSRAANAVIDFSNKQDNLSAKMANSFARLTPDPRTLTIGDKINLYVEYIDRKTIGVGL